MRKSFSYLVIFVLGVGVCFLLLRAYGRFGIAGPDQARRNVLALLNKQPVGADIPDSALVKAAQRITPAVVNIDTASERLQQSVGFFGQPVERLLRLQGKGSGVLISADGYIVTNNHVIEEADTIRVTTVDGRKYDGHLVAADPDADIAVVKIDAAHLPYAELGDSDKLKVGEYVLAIGYPLGIGTTVTHGIISATDRHDLPVGEGRYLKQALQTDAPINHGNSGGALANLDGQLIGINTAIASENNGGSIGIGFAIPINPARSIIKDLIANGRNNPAPVEQPFIGITYEPLSRDLAQQNSAPLNQGVLVTGVLPSSPADQAGLKPGSIILQIDGRPILGLQDVATTARRHRVGEVITLRMLRGDGSQDDVKVTLGRRPKTMVQ